MIQEERRDVLANSTLVVGTSPPSNSPRFAQEPTIGSVRPEKRNMGEQNDRVRLVTYTV